MVHKLRKQDCGKSKARLGLTGRLLVGIIIPLVVILFILAAVVSLITIKVISDIKNEGIYNQVSTASTQVEDYFKKFFVSVQFLKDKPYVIGMLKDLQNATPDFRFQNSVHFKDVVLDIQQVNRVQGRTVKAVWVAGVKNRQIVRSDGYISNTNYPLEDQIWYPMLQQDPKSAYLSSLHTPPDSDTDVVTVTTGICDESGNMIGMVGIDIEIVELSGYLSTLKIGAHGGLTIYDAAQRIVYHPDPSLLRTSAHDGHYSQNLIEVLTGNQDIYSIIHKRGDMEFHASVKQLPEFGWTVLGGMPQSEYLQETKFIIFTLVVGFIICIMVLISICTLHSRKMVKPLKTLNRAAKEFAKGNLDIELQKTTDDEVGDLTDVFIHTQASLKEIISDIGYVIQGLSQKNLTVQPTAQYQGAFVEIESSLQGIASRMNSVLHVINSTADQVDSWASQVAGGAQSLAHGSTEQAHSVDQLAEDIQDISQKMRDMVQYAQQTSDSARDVGEDVQQTSNQMQMMLQAMQRIDQSSNEIQKIMKAIEDIAFQTNILALNAAVEAARAGAAGKGFAVVADEVRNLAGRSAEASKTTATLISNSLSAVKDGMRIAQEANSALCASVTDVQKIAQNIHGVSDHLQDHVKLIEALTTGVGQISVVVQTNSAAAEESAAASQELSAQANTLKHMMSEFQFDKKRDK